MLTAPASSGAQAYKKTAAVMGTALEITVVSDDAAKAGAAFDAVLREMARVEGVMSEWKEGTPVSEINRNAGVRAVAVPRELFDVISASIEVSRLTDSAFDVTWASMRGVWDFSGKGRVPSREEVEKRLGSVDYRNIVLDKENLTVFLKKRGSAIGLGAIAKGYAVDMAMQALSDAGIRDAIIKAGGDMRVQGRGEDGLPWEIAVRHPRDRQRPLAGLRLSNISISTSGDYERSFVKEGILYHHIIDPKTGFPARGCQSVTILAPDTMTSDALSTAVFVLGPEKGMRLIKGLKGVEAIIVDGKGGISASGGIRQNSP